MPNTILVGLDGHASGERALAMAQKFLAADPGGSLVVAFVIEWSPYSFHTAEENAQRKKRRVEEIEVAQTRVIDPALAKLKAAGIEAKGVVRHGDVADTLNALAKEHGANHIVIGHQVEDGFTKRIFGGTASNLVASATVTVTIAK